MKELVEKVAALYEMCIRDRSEGVASAYWEIARELKFWKGPFSAHLEYNGGLAKGFSYNNAYLAGATYTYNNASFSRGFTLTAMYKYIQKHPSPRCV